MPRERIKLEVTIDLDPVPGAMHTATSAHRSVLLVLQDRFSSYNPEVNFEGFGMTAVHHNDLAKIISEDDVSAGGEFFMHDEAVIGWWCVRSTDPEKRDLFLPTHIFRKCFTNFTFGNVTTAPGWVAVVELA